MALIYDQGKRQVPRKAHDNAARALALGLGKPRSIALANLLVAEYELEVGRLAEAIDHLSQGIQALDSVGQPALTGELYYQRAIAHRRNAQFNQATADIEQAITLIKAAGDGQALTRFEAEKVTIRAHAGQAHSRDGYPGNRGR